MPEEAGAGMRQPMHTGMPLNLSRWRGPAPDCGGRGRGCRGIGVGFVKPSLGFNFVLPCRGQGE